MTYTFWSFCGDHPILVAFVAYLAAQATISVFKPIKIKIERNVIAKDDEVKRNG